MDTIDWSAFLAEWSRELLAIPDLAAALPAEVVATGWLGFPGATDAQLARADAHLGRALPPSYREFLRVTNGWRYTGNFNIPRLWSTEEIEWFSVRHQEWIDAYMEGWTQAAGEDDESESLAADFCSALEISDEGDGAIYLLNPRVMRADGEWEAWFFANWSGRETTYPSFREMLVAERDLLAAVR